MKTKWKKGKTTHTISLHVIKMKTKQNDLGSRSEGEQAGVSPSPTDTPSVLSSSKLLPKSPSKQQMSLLP
jgi:hypothetical protein